MQNLIVNVRGGSGAGKTTTMRRFLKEPHEILIGPSVKNPDKQEIKGYLINCSALGIQLPVFLVGSYKAVNGGTDSVNTQEEIGDRVEMAFNAGGHVLVEGLLMSKSGPGGHLSPRMKELAGDRMWFAFLDTPADVCHERVKQRRLDAGNTKPLDPDRTLFPGVKQALKSKVLLDREGGYQTHWLDHTGDPAQEIINLMVWSEK